MRKYLIATMTLTALMGAACGGGGGSPSGGGGTTGSAGAGPAGSGGGAPTGGGGQSTQGDGSFEPAPVGATWEYDTTDEGADGGTVTGTKSVAVEALEPVPGRAGITAARIHTIVPGAEDQNTWQAETATAIVRYRDEIYVAGSGTSSQEEVDVYAPSKLRVDITHLTTNQTYAESYTESVTQVTQGNNTVSTSKPFDWKVIDGNESITVPAGTFTALHVRKANGNSGAIDKDYWFVRGVGKVKETVASTNRVEVLRAYHLP